MAGRRKEASVARRCACDSLGEDERWSGERGNAIGTSGLVRLDFILAG